MSKLDIYLAQHFQNDRRFASECGLSVKELDDLILQRLIPRASYVVSGSSVTSYLFGEMPAPASANGCYFPPLNKIWVLRAQEAIARAGCERAYDVLKEQFAASFRAALAELNATTWRLHDSFAGNGIEIPSGLDVRLESAWEHFLQGTFGLCVANPISETAIAWKVVLQEKLVALSGNGAKTEFSAADRSALLATIAAYAQATMPFSPVEYPLSSRKRLVHDLLRKINAVDVSPA